jgi:3-hydroxyisobutyrate dehydrogenase
MSTSQPRPRVAVLGTGIMGSGMAERLLDEGFPVNVWDGSPDRTAPLAARGATAYPAPDQAVRDAAAVVTMLPTGDVASGVMLRQGVIDAFPPNSVWAQMGTVGVEATEQMNAEVAKRRPDVAFVDVPVSGTKGPARTGKLLILASGPDRARPLLEPVFGALGQRTVWLGPAGTGSRMKLVLNVWLAFEAEAAAEVNALSSRLGIPYATLNETVAGGPLASTFALAKLQKMAQGDHSTEFPLEWALKDLHLAGTASGPDAVPVSVAIADRWQRLVDRGLGRLDVSAAGLGLTGDIPAEAGPATGRQAK